jgi:hypothetical protein
VKGKPKGERGELLAALCLLLVTAVISAPAGGTSVAIYEDRSLEWEVELADLVVRGTVRPGAQRDVDVKGGRAHEVTLDVGETIKGKPSAQVTFVIPPGERVDLPANSWSDVLVFLNWQDDAVRTNVGSTNLGRWVSAGGWLIVLGPEMPAIQRMDGSSISNGEELLRAAREAANFAKARGAPCEEGQFRGDRFGRAGVGPKQSRLQPRGERLLEDADVSRRRTAIELLGQMPSPANRERLRQMLKDPVFDVGEGVAWTSRLEERAWKVYPLRREAVWSLGTERQADFIEPHMRYAAASWRGWVVGLGLILGVVLLWPRRWGAGGWGRRLAIACVGLACIVATLWWRSGRAGETYSFAAGGADYEVVSVAGRVGLLRVQDSAPPHGWMVRRFDRQQYCDGGGFWFETLLKPAQEAAWRRLYLAEGQTAGAGHYSYRFLALPYWALMSVAALWPTAWGIAQLRQARRRLRWLRGNRCGR